MSFDLMVYFKNPPDDLVARWEDALRDAGLPLRFPPGYNPFAADVEAELELEWRGTQTVLEGALQEKTTGFPYFEIRDMDREEAKQNAESEHVPLALKRTVKEATHEAYFTTSSGRSAFGIALQMYGAAALAKATGGVVCDPQERGYITSAEAAEYARETVASMRAGEIADRQKQEEEARERADALKELNRRWLWFRNVFIAASVYWVVYILLVTNADRLGINPTSSLMLVFVGLLIAIVVFSARATRAYFETIGLRWPIPWMLGILAVFTPIYAVLVWWGGRKHDRLKRLLAMTG